MKPCLRFRLCRCGRFFSMKRGVGHPRGHQPSTADDLLVLEEQATYVSASQTVCSFIKYYELLFNWVYLGTTMIVLEVSSP
eukprot:CAMPEP_0183825976 /NCGR_PEP_ID=MMETSP0807_2-20130328/1436_1 /TAXON_ID=88271 /ORGANISM="Picocystis salinarum, Strain CCMP1897" /LENGTH=80 /DNA_ID=CAMNT_0026071037 /DNA_START=2960 /DNA_END=3199 /DNA_ORIENTATION=-